MSETCCSVILSSFSNREVQEKIRVSFKKEYTEAIIEDQVPGKNFYVPLTVLQWLCLVYLSSVDLITKLYSHLTMLFYDAMSNMMSFRSPRRRRSRSSSRSRRGRREQSRSRESRWRSRSQDRSDRENNRERRQKGLPSIKSQTLSGMCYSKQNQMCECIIQSCMKAFLK